MIVLKDEAKLCAGNGNRTNETDKTLAIIIGIVAGVILLIVFLSYCSKKFDKKGI